MDENGKKFELCYMMEQGHERGIFSHVIALVLTLSPRRRNQPCDFTMMMSATLGYFNLVM